MGDPVEDGFFVVIWERVFVDGGHGAGADLFADFDPEADVVAFGVGGEEGGEVDVAFLEVLVVAVDACVFDDGEDFFVECFGGGIELWGGVEVGVEEGCEGDDEEGMEGGARHVGSGIGVWV